MAQKVAVLGENRHVKRSIADLLVRRLTHEPVMALIGDKLRLIGIKALPLRAFNPAPIVYVHPIYARAHEPYQHHIEPRIERISPAERYSWEYFASL